jgi:hypothetical protein
MGPMAPIWRTAFKGSIGSDSAFALAMRAEAEGAARQGWYAALICD